MKKIMEKGSSFFAVFYSLPWCCILPVILSSLGLITGLGAVRTLTVRAWPLFLVASILFLARAHWLVYYRRSYNPFYILIVWINTLIVAYLWATRFQLI